MGTRFAFNFSERTESSLFGFQCSLLLNHLYFTFFLDALAALYLPLAQKCLVMGNFQSVPPYRKGTAAHFFLKHVIETSNKKCQQNC